MKRVVLILAIMIMLPYAAQADTISMSAERLFQKAFDYAVESGAMPTDIDKIGMSFTTYPAPVSPDATLIDCGNTASTPAVEDKRARTGIKYIIKVTPVSDKVAKITVKVDIEGYMADSENAPEFHIKNKNTLNALNCRSTGGFEASLLDAMRN